MSHDGEQVVIVFLAFGVVVLAALAYAVVDLAMSVKKIQEHVRENLTGPRDTERLCSTIETASRRTSGTI